MNTKPVVLLLLEGTYPWYRGGVSEWVAQYLKAFPDYDFRILQVATDEYLNRKMNASIYKIPGNIISFTRIPPPDLANDWRLESKKWFEQNRTHISGILHDITTVHATNTGFAGWLGTVLASEIDVPVVLTEHAIYWKEIDMGAVALECGYKIPGEMSQKKRFVEMFRSMAKEIYTHSDYIISVSECNINEQKKLGARDSVYIPNGVGEDFFRNEDIIRDNATLNIGWIGRCANMKNPMRFLDLAAAFREQQSFDVSFLMMLSDAGEKKLEKEVRNKSRDYPELKLIWNKPAIAHIREMDAVCITSYNESQPLVLFEALANKSLPVGWKAGDANGKFGIFINQSRDAGILRDKIVALRLDRKKWMEEVNTRYDFLCKQHTWNSVFARYRKIFESIN